jgi:hypothetical protein
MTALRSDSANDIRTVQSPFNDSSIGRELFFVFQCLRLLGRATWVYLIRHVAPRHSFFSS